MRRAQFAQLREFLVVQDIALVVIAALLAIGVIMLLVAAGSRSEERHRRDIRDTQARRPQTRR